MRKLALLLLLLAVPATAQQNTGTSRRIIYGSALPATCSPNTGDVYFKTAATIGPYYCSAANTWSTMGAGAGALTGTGTAAQVAHWSGTTALTGTAGFTFAAGLLTATNLTASGLTANSFLYSGTGGALTSTTAPTNGKLLIGSTGAAPVSATLTAGSSKLSVTNGAGSISLDAVPANFTITDFGGTLTAVKGGTGQTVFAVGDILYASTTTALSRLPIGTASQVLTVSGSLPVWASASAAAAHNFLSATHSDSTPGTATRGDIVTAQTASALWKKLAVGASGTLLRSDGTDPAWGAAVLTTDVSGILPSANGGTGLAFFTVAGPATSAKTFTFPNASSTVLTSNAAVTAAQGGTGQTSYTTGDLLYASSASALSKLGIGGAGNLLTVSGGIPAWTAAPASAPHTMLSAEHTDTLAGSVARGDLIIGNSTPKFARLAIGTLNKVLWSDGTDPSWTSTPILQSSLQLGVVSSATGSFKLAHASSANLTTITAGNASTAETYVWPTTDGTSGQQLTTDSNGVLSWAAPGSGGSTTGIVHIYPGGYGPDGSGTGNDSATVVYETSTGTQTANTPKVQQQALSFDAATDQHWIFTLQLPNNYSSGGTLRGTVRLLSATGNVILKAGQVSTTNNSDSDTAPVFVAGDLSAAISSANTSFLQTFTIALTATGMAANKKCVIFIARDADNASDTNASAARLVSLDLEFTTS